MTKPYPTKRGLMKFASVLALSASERGPAMASAN